MTLAEFLELVRTAGTPAALLFCTLWWFERDERKDAQKELKSVAEKSTIAMTELKVLISQLYVIFGNKNGAGS